MPMTVAKLREFLKNYDSEALIAVSDTGPTVLHVYDMGEDAADVLGWVEIPDSHL